MSGVFAFMSFPELFIKGTLRSYTNYGRAVYNAFQQKSFKGMGKYSANMMFSTFVLTGGLATA